MNTQRNNTRTAELPDTSDPTPALPTIIRGEEVLTKAREVAHRISDRVSQAVTERAQSDDRSSD